MPEHVHLLVSEPEVEALATAIQALKISVARRAMSYLREPTSAKSGQMWGTIVPPPTSAKSGQMWGTVVPPPTSAKNGQMWGATVPLWQKRYYDHNVRNYESFVGKLRYIHRNPVKRALVEKPEDWKWSSFRHYATAEIGPVEIESQWTADRRDGRTPRLLQMPAG